MSPRQVLEGAFTGRQALRLEARSALGEALLGL
jgi:hypothetical protein